MCVTSRYEVNISISDKSNLKKVRDLIQETIDECHSNGGGTVFIPAGEYIVSSIAMRSNVRLLLDDNCVLVSPILREQFIALEDLEPCNYESSYYSDFCSIIYARDCNNFSIEGGKIVGRDKEFWTCIEEIGDSSCSTPPRYRAKSFRPWTLLFFHCENVIVTGLSIENSPVYSAWVLNSKNITFTNSKVANNFYGPNTDGYHFSSCIGVLVDGCEFITGDDSIAVDGENNGFACDTVIRNCTFTTAVNVLRLYTGLDPALKKERYSRVKNLVMHDCKILDAAGVMNVSAKNGDISDVEFFNMDIQMEREGTSFFFMTDNGNITNVSIKNIKSNSNGVGTIIGTAKNNIKNVVIENCDFTVTPKKKMYELEIPDPIPSYTYHHYAPCNLYIRHMQKLKLENVAIHFIDNPLFIHKMSAVALAQSKDIYIHNLDAKYYGEDCNVQTISNIDCTNVVIS